MYYSLPGSSVCGTSQARLLEWIAISFSRGSSKLRSQTQVSCTAGRWDLIRYAEEKITQLSESESGF